MNAQRALLIQNLMLTWRYSIGNPYEEFSFPESLDEVQVLAEYGFPGCRPVDRAHVTHAQADSIPELEDGRELPRRRRRLTASATSETLIAQTTPTLRRYVDAPRRTQRGERAARRASATRPIFLDSSSGCTRRPLPWAGPAGDGDVSGATRATTRSHAGRGDCTAAARGAARSRRAGRRHVPVTARCSCRCACSTTSRRTRCSPARGTGATGTSLRRTRSPPACSALATRSERRCATCSNTAHASSVSSALERSRCTGIRGSRTGLDQVYGLNTARLSRRSTSPTSSCSACTGSSPRRSRATRSSAAKRPRFRRMRAWYCGCDALPPRTASATPRCWRLCGCWWRTNCQRGAVSSSPMRRRGRGSHPGSESPSTGYQPGSDSSQVHAGLACPFGERNDQRAAHRGRTRCRCGCGCRAGLGLHLSASAAGRCARSTGAPARST